MHTYNMLHYHWWNIFYIDVMEQRQILQISHQCR